MPPPGTGRERLGKGPADLFSEQPAAAGKKGATGTNDQSNMTTLILSKPLPQILESSLLTKHQNTDLINLSRHPSASYKSSS